MKITLIQAGGTIDKSYPRGKNNHGYNFEIKEPAFVSILKKIKPIFKYEILSVLKKDSLDITNKDRKKLLSVVEFVKNDKIVITHGTDTIRLTAKKLSEISDKTIIITGAMLPEKFRDSDAEFNLGAAIAFAQILPRGVYISIKGKIFEWREFKNIK